MAEKDKFDFHAENLDFNLHTMQKLKKYNSAIIKLIKDCKPDLTHTLDFGAGIGTFAELLAADTPSLVCLEPDHKERAILEQRKFNTAAHLDHIPDNSQTFIYHINVLEHIENDTEILKHLSKKLVPNGKMFIYTPAFNFLFTDLDRQVQHHRRYNKKDLRNKLEAAGFKIEKMVYTDFIGFFAVLAYKLSRSKSSFNEKSALIYDRHIFPLNRLFEWLFKAWIGKNIVAVVTKE